MKKLLIFLLMAVLLAGTISAFEFDNIKSYDHFKKEVTIRNAFGLGKDIAKIKLNTPLVYHVPRGYQKVAEFNVSSYGEYKSFINRIKLYDKRKGMKEITTERKLDFKYKDYEEVVVNDYKKECSLVMNETTGNETQVCENIIIGNHTEKRVVWRDFNNNIPKGDITIGIFTEVKKGDNIEWIPNFVGVEVTEWAEWTEDLNSGLVSYYKLDETSGSVIDSAGSNDGTNNGATPNVAGKINTAYSFDGNNDYIDLSHITDFYDDLSEGTLSYWFYSDTRHSGAMVWHYEEGGRRFYSVIYNSDKTKLQMGLGSASSVGTHTWNLSSWNHVVVVWNGTHFSQYLNNVLDINSNPYSYDSFTTGDNSPISLGLDASGNQVYFNGIIDEVGLWNRALNDSEISDLYNNGDGITYTKRLKISLLSPVDTYNSTTSSIDFSANVSDPNSLGIANVSLYIDGVINQTNSSGVEGIYNFSVGGLSEGNHNWSVKAVDSTNGDTYESEVRYFNVNTTPIITISSPVSNTNYPTSNIWFNATSSLNVDYWVINYNGTNITIDDQSGTSLSKLLNVNDGTYNLTIYANNSNTGVWGVNNSVKNFMVDVNPPTISVTSPTGTYDYLYEDYNLTLNTTITDTNLDTCWYSYNGENKTFSCSSGVLSTEYFNYTKGVNNLIVYANDTAGNENSTSVSWDYSIFQDNMTYAPTITTLTVGTYELEINYSSSIWDGISAVINYNGTNYGSTKTENGDNVNFNATLTIPAVSNSTTFSFYWIIFLTNSTGTYNYTSPMHSQTVIPFSIDDCSVNSVLLYNFTIRDENSQNILNGTGNNTEGKVDISVYSPLTREVVDTYSHSYKKTNPFQVCVSSNLSGREQFELEALIEYSANNYRTEYYNIKNKTLNNNSLNSQVNLYDVLTSQSQPFKIILKDASYLAISDATIEIHRRYIDEGVYKIVEIPKTDSNGETSASLVTDSVIYKFVIKKDKKTLATFKDVRAYCQNPSITTCTINLNTFATGVTVPDYYQAEDLNYTIEYNKNTRTIRTQFIVPSGTSSVVKLVVEKTDALGTEVCTKTITGDEGVLTCEIPKSIGNETIIAKVYKDGSFEGSGSIKLDQSSSDIYGGIVVFLALFVFLSLLGAGLSDNPVFTIIFLFVGLIILFAMNLVTNNGFIGKTATILWIMVAIILVLIKGARRS